MKKYILIILFSLYVCSCYSSDRDPLRIWDMDIELFENSLKSANSAFLTSFDYEKLNRKGRLKEIFKLGPGAAYYFSYILEEHAMFSEQLLFLELEMNEGRWRKKALIEINDIFSERENWALLSQYLDRYIREIESDPEIYVKLIKSLYREGRYRKLIEFSDRDFSDYHVLLSLIETGDSSRNEALSEFLFNGAEPEEIEAIYIKLHEKGVFYELDESLRLYILAFTSFVRGEFTQSGEFFNNIKIDMDLMNTYQSFFYKLQIPLQVSGQGKRWAAAFQSGNPSFASSFVAGRLFLYEKDFVSGENSFRRAVELAETDFEIDRARWYLMNLYKTNLFFFASLIEEFAPLWNDPSYFSDILDDYLALIVSRGEWAVFDRIYPLIDSYGDDDMRNSYSWVKLLAMKSRLIQPGDEEKLFKQLIDSRHLSFYNVAGTLLSGEKISLEEEQAEPRYSATDEFINGFLIFNLNDQAIDYSRGLENMLNDEILRKLSLYASQKGDNLRSIQLINYVTSREGYRYGLSDLKLMYPSLYESEIETYSREYGFSGELMSGIIRTESAFTHDIISRAGAVGLSQLMPETAAEQARKLKIEHPDLTDPGTNVRIGSSYLKWIIDRDWTENLSEVLIAYNAGGGNLRRWKRSYPPYRDELFAEAIPYKETRNYVKKVMTSSIVYGYLYKNLEPEDVLKKIYPDFYFLKSTN